MDSDTGEFPQTYVTTAEDDAMPLLLLSSTCLASDAPSRTPSPAASTVFGATTNDGGTSTELGDAALQGCQSLGEFLILIAAAYTLCRRLWCSSCWNVGVLYLLKGIEGEVVESDDQEEALTLLVGAAAAAAAAVRFLLLRSVSARFSLPRAISHRAKMRATSSCRYNTFSALIYVCVEGTGAAPRRLLKCFHRRVLMETV